MAAATADVPCQTAPVSPENQDLQNRTAANFSAALLAEQRRLQLRGEAESEGELWKGLGRNQSPLRLLASQTYCQSGEKAFHCSQPHCAKAFASKYKLLRHMATHSQQKTHQCSFCEKMFHRKDHLKNHLQTHDPNKEAFRCEECGKRYHTKLGYRRHAAMHSAASGDLTCKVCLLGCESTAALLEHLRGHSGKPPVGGVTRERRHPCAHCDRRFYTRKDVRRHLVVHTGRKDFLCPHCAQRFGRKDHLTRHAKKSHPQEPLEGKAELTPPPNAIKEELGHLSCGGPPRVHPGNKPFAGVFPVGLYEPHLQPAHTSPACRPGMGRHMEAQCGPAHPSAQLALPVPLSHHQHHQHHLQQQQQHHPPPLPPSSKYQPGSTSSYLKMEMESFLMDLQSGLPLPTLPEPQALPPAPPHILPGDESESLCADILLPKGPAESLCGSSMDFSHLLGFLPLNLPPYSTPIGTGGLVMGYPAASSSSSTSSSSSSSHVAETLGTALASAQVPHQESLSSLPLGFSSTLSSSTLPRFHQAFQ